MKLLKNSIFNSLLFFTLSIVLFCCNSNYQKSETNTENQIFNSDKLKTIDGIYILKNDAVELEVRINNNSWSGTTMQIIGAGNAYKKENIQYVNEITKGNDLYEKADFIKIGTVNDNNLTTSIGRQKVLLNRIDL